MTIVMVYHDNLRDDNQTYDAKSVLAMITKRLKKSRSATNSTRRPST